MLSENKWVFVWLLAVSLGMLALNDFFNWWLLPDLVLLLLMQWFLRVPMPSLWWAVLPMSLLLDFSAQMAMGFYALLYAGVGLAVIPLAPLWLRSSWIERLVLVALVSLGYVVVRALLAYALTGIPAPVGWYIPVVLQVVCWPLVRWVVLVFGGAVDKAQTS